MYYYRLISSMLKAVISTLGTGLYAVYKAESDALASLTTSLYAVYKGESNANDSLGNYNGTPYGGLTYTAGKSGNAFTFNGTDAYVSLPVNTLSSLTDFSISFWYNPSSLPAGSALVGNYTWIGGIDRGYLIYLNYGTLYFRLWGSSTVDLVASGTFSTNTWYHVVLTRKESTRSKLYINGSLNASNTSTVNPNYTTTNYNSLGASQYNATNKEYYCNGKMDEVNIWNKELTSTEITDLYNSGNGKFYQGNTFSSTIVNDSLATYNGTAQGGLTYSGGKSGNAFTFNGTDAYVSLPDNMFNSLTGDFSINMWVNIVNTGTLQTLLSCKAYDGTNAWGFSLFNYGTSRFDITYGSSSAITLLDNVNGHEIYNTWYMVTVTRKASTGTKIYYNGTLAASNTSTQNIVFNPTTNKCAIGAYVLTYPLNVGTVYYLANGSKLDELNIWSKELSSTEVTELYNASTGKFYPY